MVTYVTLLLLENAASVSVTNFAILKLILCVLEMDSALYTPTGRKTYGQTNDHVNVDALTT